MARLFLTAWILCFLLLRSLCAQDLAMEIESVTGLVDEVVTAAVAYENGGVETFAFTVVVCHDPDVVTVEGLAIADELEDEAEFVYVLGDDSWRAAAIPLVPSEEFEEFEGDLLEVEYTLESGGVTDLNFCELDRGRGETRVTEVIHWNDDYELVAAEPTTTAGAITVLVPFARGDVDGSGAVSGLLDAIALLEWFFSDGDLPECMDAADVDDSGSVSVLVDALYLLNYAFNDGEAIPEPTVESCDTDPTDDDLYCGSYACD